MSKSLNWLKNLPPVNMPEHLILVKTAEGDEIGNADHIWPGDMEQLKTKYECVDLNRIKMLDHHLGLYGSKELGQVKIREEHLPWNGFCSIATYHIV